MDERTRLLQRTLDGEGIDQHGERLRNAALNGGADTAAWEQIEALDLHLRTILRRESPEQLADQLDRLRAAIPSRRQPAANAIPAAWVAAGLAAACIVLLFPLTHGVGGSSLTMIAWMSAAGLVAVLLLLAATLPLGPGSPLLRWLLYTRVPLGPIDRAACIASGLCVLITIAVVAR